jgi:hypothetical protein
MSIVADMIVHGSKEPTLATIGRAIEVREEDCLRGG